MNEKSAKLLQAASEMVGGDQALAQRLGIDQSLLSRLMAGEQAMPEQVLLRTVDIIMEHHEVQQAARPRAVQASPDPVDD